MFRGNLLEITAENKLVHVILDRGIQKYGL